VTMSLPERKRPMTRVGAVIAGAGMSSRMGDFKPLLPYGGTTIAKHIITMVKEAGADPVLVVTGFRGDELEAHLGEMGIRFLRNKEYGTTQMFDSVCLGIRAIAAECDRILLMPIDTPAIRPETFYRVMHTDADMVRTVCNGQPGHPVLLSTRAAMDLLGYRGCRGLRGAMEESGYLITDLPVEDPGVNRDVDTPRDYREILRADQGTVSD